MSEPDDERESLQRIPFFAELSREDVDGILAVGSRVTFEPGSTIVEQGSPGDGMYVVLSGTAEVDVGGRYHKMGPGDFFGEMALITSRTRMATVKSADRVDALKIPAEGFRSFLLDPPAVAISMLEAIVERLREVEQRIDAWMA